MPGKWVASTQKQTELSSTCPSSTRTGEKRGGGEALLGLLAAVIFMPMLDMRAAAPLLPAISRDLHESVAATGLIVTAYTLPYAAFQLAYGPLADRFGRLRVIAAAYAVFVVGTGLTSVAPSLSSMVLVRALTGAVAAAVYTQALAHIGDTVPYSRRIAAVGLLAGTGSVAQVLSVSVGGILGELFSWRVVYAIFGVLAAGTWLVLMRALRTISATPPVRVEVPAGRAVERLVGQYLHVLRVRGAGLLYGMVFVENFFLHGGFAYLGASLVTRFDASLLLVGLLLTGYGVGAFVVARAIGRMVPILGERGLVLVGGLTMSAGYGLALLAPDWPYGFPAAVLMGTGFTAAHTTLQTRMTDLDPRARGTALGLHSFHSLLGQAIGAAILGGILGLTGAYQPLLAACAAGLALFGLAGGLLMPSRPVRLDSEKPLAGV